MTRVSSRRRAVATALTIAAVLWLFLAWLVPSVRQTWQPDARHIEVELGGFGFQPWITGHVEFVGNAPRHLGGWSAAFSPAGLLVALLATLPVLWILRRGNAQIVRSRLGRVLRLEF